MKVLDLKAVRDLGVVDCSKNTSCVSCHQKKALRERWLLDGVGSGREQEEMKRQNQQDLRQTQVLEQSILRYGLQGLLPISCISILSPGGILMLGTQSGPPFGFSIETRATHPKATIEIVLQMSPPQSDTSHP